MKERRTVGAVHTHTHTHTIHSTKKNGNYLLDEPQFSKINIEENRGKKASICDRKKDRDKAIDIR